MRASLSAGLECPPVEAFTAEQADLRATGTLPTWFTDAVLKHAKTVQREMQRAR